MRRVGPGPAHELGMTVGVYRRYVAEHRRWDRRWHHIQALRAGLVRRPVRRVLPGGIYHGH